MSTALETWRARAQRFFERDLWRGARTDGLAGAGRHALQLAVIVAQGAARNQMLLRASGLAYFTMLSLIPLLAVALSLVEAFGVSRDLARFLVERIAAAGSPEAATRIVELVERVDFRSLGVLGGAALLVTTVLALSNVERAFNTIWGVPRQRPLMRRFPDYLAVLVIAPLLLAVALSLATSLRSDAFVQRLLTQPLLSDLYHLGLSKAPTLLLWGAFAFLFWFLPNTQVRLVPALCGGALAAILFAVAQQVYLGFNVGVVRSSALFGSFAALPLLLVWIYVSWMIVLLGAELAFAQQNLASFRQAREGEEPRPAAREAIGLAVAVHVARVFRDAGSGVTAERLAEVLDVPVRTVRGVLAELEAGGVVAPRGDAKLDGYQLGRAAEAIPVAEVLAALRGPREAGAPRAAGDVPVRALIGELDAATGRALRDRTLAELAEGASGA